MTPGFYGITLSGRASSVSAPGARGRKARWKVRHALLRKHRRRPHPQREVRRVQRFIANWDAMQELAGAALALCLVVLGGCSEEARLNASILFCFALVIGPPIFAITWAIGVAVTECRKDDES